MNLFWGKPSRSFQSDQIKAANIRSILLELLINEKMTKLALSYQIALSDTTINECTNYLIANHLLVASKAGVSSGGRRPVIYHLEETYGYFIRLHLSEVHSSKLS